MTPSVLLVGGIASCFTAAVGVFMQATVGAGDIPWDKIGNVGIVGAVVGVGGYFLRRENAIRAELAAAAKLCDAERVAELQARDAVNKAIAEKFGETSNSITKTFADTVAAQEQRAQQREARLHELLDRAIQDNP